jgi:hypothetical protein
LRNWNHIVGSAFVVVPGASFGLLCQVELEIILYYLAKSFVFIGLLFYVFVSSLKRFGMHSLIDIKSAGAILGWTMLGLRHLTWTELGKRSELPVLVFALVEMRELVKVLFFLSLTNHAGLEKLRSLMSSNILLCSHVHRCKLNRRWLFLIRLVQVSVRNVSALAP